MASNVQAGPVISPPVIIVLCIIVSVVLVIVVAATYRLCRQATGGADGNVEGQRWNPNKRPKEQVSYMERVRWRNNMSAWDRAQISRLEDASSSDGGYRRGMLRQQYEERQAQEQGAWSTINIHRVEESVVSPYNASRPLNPCLSSRLTFVCGRVKRSQQNNSLLLKTHTEKCCTNRRCKKVSRGESLDHGPTSAKTRIHHQDSKTMGLKGQY